jgi:uncharacterized protein DUF3800
MPSASPPIYHIYCDESRQTKDRFMILAGVVINAKSIEDVVDKLRAFRERAKMTAELKWTKVSRGKLNQYKEIIDIFVDFTSSNVVHFKALIFDCHQIDHRSFSDGDNEVGFYKFYYQLLLHCFGKPYCTTEHPMRFMVFLDERNTTYKLTTLKAFLNRGMASKFGIQSSPFRQIEPRNSHKCDITQMLDIVVGAVGYQRNMLHRRKDANPAKVELAAYLAKKLGWPHLLFDTNPHVMRFKLWTFRLQKKKAP